MGVFDLERNKIRQQEIEVRALVALFNSSNEVVSFKARQRLEDIAYLEELAEKINQTKLSGPLNKQWGIE